MMDTLLSLLKLINTFTPAGIIVLLIGLVYLAFHQRKQVEQLSDNHLHEVLEVLHRIEVSLARLEANIMRILGHVDRD
jgi:hypothetical protein